MPTPPAIPTLLAKGLTTRGVSLDARNVFRLVETVLSSPYQNSVVLFGQRRIGKTSIC